MSGLHFVCSLFVQKTVWLRHKDIYWCQNELENTTYLQEWVLTASHYEAQYKDPEISVEFMGEKKSSQHTNPHRK